MKPLTKRRIQRMIAPTAIILLGAVIFATFYGINSQPQVVSVYTLGGTYLEGEEFQGSSLIPVELSLNDPQVLSSLVISSDEFSAGTYTAARNLTVGSFLLASDYYVGAVDLSLFEEEEIQSVQIENRIFRQGTVVQTPNSEDPAIATTPGVYHIVTDHIPPKHVACIRHLDTDGVVLMAPEDAMVYEIWSILQRTVSIRHTQDECPLGDFPFRCSILTNAHDPASEVRNRNSETGEERRYAYADKGLVTESGDDSNVIIVPLEACEQVTPADLVAVLSTSENENEEIKLRFSAGSINVLQRLRPEKLPGVETDPESLEALRYLVELARNQPIPVEVDDIPSNGDATQEETNTETEIETTIEDLIPETPTVSDILQ